MRKPLFAALLALPVLMLSGPSSATDNCDPIKAQIEAKMRAGGLSNFSLVTVELGTSRSGRVVGTCGMGSRQIVYLPSVALGDAASGVLSPASPAPRRAAARENPADKIPTECKDGSVVVGPDCDNPRAVRMSKAHIEKAASAP